MNEIMNRLSTLRANRIFCMALGLTLAFICQQARAQSAPPPKGDAKLAKTQAILKEYKSEKEDLIAKLKAEAINIKIYDTELKALKKREATLSVSADSYPEILKTIQSQRVQLSIDLAGLDARYDAVAIAIGEATKKQNEEVLKPYKRLVELREAKLNQLTKNAATTSKEKRDAAEVELLEARLRLAEASKPSGSLSHLNSQLLDTSLERAEKTARLEKANSLFKDVEEYRKFNEAFASTQNKLQTAVSREQELLKNKTANETRITRLEELISKHKNKMAEEAE